MYCVSCDVVIRVSTYGFSLRLHFVSRQYLHLCVLGIVILHVDLYDNVTTTHTIVAIHIHSTVSIMTTFTVHTVLIGLQGVPEKYISIISFYF